MYIELTINRDTAFKSMDEINRILQYFGYKVVLVSREITATTNNIHFHVLVELTEKQEQDIQITLNDLYVSTNYIARIVKNLNATIIYFIKDGRYKVYNDFIIPHELKKHKIDMQLLVKDIIDGYTYHELVIKYGVFVLKNAYGINQLIGSIRFDNNKRKE